MRDLNYLKNRFENALFYKKPLQIGVQDVKALNGIIKYFQENEKENKLEDSLILFYILQHWHIENNNFKMNFKNNNFKITSPENILEKLFMLLDPKEKIVEMITTELGVNQTLQGIEKSKIIRKSEVRTLLNEAIKKVKTGKYAISQINLIEYDGANKFSRA